LVQVEVQFFMYTRLVSTFLVAGGFAFAAVTPMSPAVFVREAALGDMAQVELGRLAVSKSSNADVKQFGQRMIDDHTKALEDLKAAAAKDNFQVPTALDDRHQAVKDRLEKLSGGEFDRAYVKEMVKDHNEDVRVFQWQAQHGTNAAIRDYASKALPTLQEHQRMIANIDTMMSGRTMTSPHQ
jgi:putative membrane protein